MEKEYQKIGNIFKFDPKHKTVVGLNEPYESLKNLIWQGTEKVDGTNTRIYWDGHAVEIAGHTDKAEFNPKALDKLNEIFKSKEMEYLFEQTFQDKKVYLFGETYGESIQSGGTYMADGHGNDFILFDVNIDGYDLKRGDVDDVARQLGLEAVPVVFEGTLDLAKAFVAGHKVSTLGGNKHEMEGLVLVPRDLQLYDNHHNMIKCKCKYRDMLKAGMAEVQ